MLFLKRITHFNEWIKCQVSGEIMRYGDYYYEDDSDGLIVKATVYKEMMRTQKEREFDYSDLENAKSEKEYRQMLKQYEKEYLQQDIYNREIYKKDGGY